MPSVSGDPSGPRWNRGNSVAVDWRVRGDLGQGLGSGRCLRLSQESPLTIGRTQPDGLLSLTAKTSIECGSITRHSRASVIPTLPSFPRYRHSHATVIPALPLFPASVIPALPLPSFPHSRPSVIPALPPFPRFRHSHASVIPTLPSFPRFRHSHASVIPALPSFPPFRHSHASVIPTLPSFPPFRHSHATLPSFPRKRESRKIGCWRTQLY